MNTTSPKNIKVAAFLIAETLDIKQFKATYTANLLYESNTELFYAIDADKHLYLFHYGVAVFANVPDVEMSQNIQLLQQYVRRPLAEKLRDDYEIEETGDNTTIRQAFDCLYVPVLDESVLKIVLFNLSQSVALDYYDKTSEALLAAVCNLSEQLEETGSLQMSRKNMLKFIGKTLNTKNRIVENLYLFDSPEMTWDDEYLDKIHRGLVRSFDLQARFREIEYTFKIVEDNLHVFRDLYQHRESAILEWIIIALILIEVGDLIISKFL